MKTVANHFILGAGTVVDAASDGIDSVTKGDRGSAGRAASDISSWSKGRFG